MSRQTCRMVSVIIPTKNSGATLRRCLESVTNQDFKSYEVIVVDGHSKDNTIQIASEFPVRILYENGGTRSSACNIGVISSKGEIVAFTDSDCEVPRDWLRKIVECFLPGVDVVGGSEVTPLQSSNWERSFGAVQKYLMPFVYEWGTVERVLGCNSAYNKEKLLAIGGFREDLLTSEETELHWRIKQRGGRILYSKDIVVIHNRRATLGKYWNQLFKYGKGRGRWLGRNPSTVKLSNIAALSSILAPVVLLSALLWFNQIWTAFILFASCLVSGLLLSLYASVREGDIALTPFVLISSILWIYGESTGQVLGLLGTYRH